MTGEGSGATNVSLTDSVLNVTHQDGIAMGVFSESLGIVTVTNNQINVTALTASGIVDSHDNVVHSGNTYDINGVISSD